MVKTFFLWSVKTFWFLHFYAMFIHSHVLCGFCNFVKLVSLGKNLISMMVFVLCLHIYSVFYVKTFVLLHLCMRILLSGVKSWLFEGMRSPAKSNYDGVLNSGFAKLQTISWRHILMSLHFIASFTELKWLAIIFTHFVWLYACYCGKTEAKLIFPSKFVLNRINVDIYLAHTHTHTHIYIYTEISCTLSWTAVRSVSSV